MSICIPGNLYCYTFCVKNFLFPDDGIFFQREFILFSGWWTKGVYYYDPNEDYLTGGWVVSFLRLSLLLFSLYGASACPCQLLFQPIFSRLFVQQTALEDKDTISFQGEKQRFLLSKIILIIFPSRANVTWLLTGALQDGRVLSSTFLPCDLDFSRVQHPPELIFTSPCGI